MGMLFGRSLLAIAAGALVLFVLFHVLFSLPVLLLAGGVAVALWMRNRSDGYRSIGRGRGYGGYLGRRSRW